MSFRIDKTARERHVDDSGHTESLPPEQRREFQAELDEAERERARAGGPAKVDDTDERLAVIESGDRLPAVAKENLVSYDDLLAHNPHLDPDRIEAGEIIFLPNVSPELAAETQRNGAGIPEGENAFVTNLRERGNAVEYADDPAAIDFDAEKAEMAGDVQDYLQALPAGERQKAAQRLYDLDWRDTGPAQVAIEQAARQEGLTLAPTTHSGPDVDGQVRDIVTAAQGKDAPVDRLKALNDAYVHASPEVKAALLRSEGGRDILQGAADWAVAGLRDLDENAGDQVPVLNLMQRLDQATQGMDKEIATRLVTQAMPGVEAEFQRSLNDPDAYPAGALSAGPSGAEALMWVADRIAGTPQGDAALDRFAEMGFYESSGVRQAIANGANPAYAVDYAAKSGNQQIFQNDVLGGIDDFRSKVGRSADAYSAHMEELNWLSANHGVAMTPEELEQAVADYRASKGPGWEQTEKDLRNAMAGDGRRLLAQLDALTTLPPELSSQQGAANAKIEETLGDSKSSNAIRVALQQDSGRLSDQTLRTLGAMGRLSDRGRKLVEEVATQALRREVLPAFADFNPNDAASVARARQAIGSLQDSRWATLLGVTDSDLSKATQVLQDALPRPGEGPDELRLRMTQMNQKLDDLTGNSGVKSFDKSTLPGQFLRTIGIAATGVSLFASARTAEANPTLKNQLKVLIDSAGLGQKTIELMEGLGALDSSSNSARVFGSSSKPAVKFLGVLGSTFDFVNAYEFYKKGDNVSAGISAAAGVGGVTAALGTGTIAGPIGLAIVGGAVIAQMLWNDVRQSNIHMNDVSADFLQHAGFDRDAATALVDQSGEGYSPVPILVKYAELKGIDMDDPAGQQAFTDWINDMPADKLAALRDNLHHALDDMNGDLGQFGATARDDLYYAWSAQQDGVPTPYQYVTFEKDKILSGDSSPSSAAQLDAVLRTLGIEAPRTA